MGFNRRKIEDQRRQVAEKEGLPDARPRRIFETSIGRANRPPVSLLPALDHF
jgi:hypothetical protein